MPSNPTVIGIVPTTPVPRRVQGDGYVPVDSDNPFPVTVATPGADSVATNHVTILDVATQIVAARTKRVDVTIVNGGTTDVYVGPAGVTAATGVLLLGIKGAAITISTVAAVYGVCAAGLSQSVSYLEGFDV